MPSRVCAFSFLPSSLFPPLFPPHTDCVSFILFFTFPLVAITIRLSHLSFSPSLSSSICENRLNPSLVPRASPSYSFLMHDLFYYRVTLYPLTFGSAVSKRFGTRCSPETRPSFSLLHLKIDARVPVAVITVSRCYHIFQRYSVSMLISPSCVSHLLAPRIAQRL